MQTRMTLLTVAVLALTVVFGARLPAEEPAKLYQTQLLTRQSNIIKDFATSGRVKIVPAVYDLKGGVVGWLELRPK